MNSPVCPWTRTLYLDSALQPCHTRSSSPHGRLHNRTPYSTQSGSTCRNWCEQQAWWETAFHTLPLPPTGHCLSLGELCGQFWWHAQWHPWRIPVSFLLRTACCSHLDTVREGRVDLSMYFRWLWLCHFFWKIIGDVGCDGS